MNIREGMGIKTIENDDDKEIEILLLDKRIDM